MLSTMTSFYSLAIFALISQASAQTWTYCNPMNVTCPDNLALGTNYSVDFTKQLDPTVWNHTNGFITPGADGSEFVINARKQSPTIQSNFYIFFGSVEIHMKPASGQGIISSIVIQSDDLDEIDWEWMGGNHTHVQSNYFGKGNQTTFDRAVYHPISNPMDEFHNYTTHWTSEKIEWIVDGQVLRTLNYGDANGGHNFPQTPSTIRLGNWAGGDPDNNKGTIEWAGGLTDFSKGPYTMIVKSAKITDYGTGKAYKWTDKSGSFQSIQGVQGNSTIATTINAPPAAPAETMSEKWAKLSSGTKTGIYAGAGCGAAAMIGLIALCCVKQRRRGKADRAAEEERQELQRKADAAYSNMSSKEQDALPAGAVPPNFAEKGYYAPSIAESDNGSLYRHNPNGVDQDSITPAPAPTVYHNSGFGSRGYTPSNQMASPVYNQPNSGYNNVRGAPSPVNTMQGNGGYNNIRGSPSPVNNNMQNNGFNFGAGAPSRSFSERQPAGYGAVPLASPMSGGGGFGGPQRSFTAQPQQQGYFPASQNRF